MIDEQHTDDSRTDFSIEHAYYSIKTANGEKVLNTVGNEFLEPELTLHYDPNTLEDAPSGLKLHINCDDGGVMRGELQSSMSLNQARDLRDRLNIALIAMADEERYFER